MALTALTILLVLLVYILYELARVRWFPPPPLPAGTAETSSDQARTLYGHVKHLSTVIGSRSVLEFEKIEETKRYILGVLAGYGWSPEIQGFPYEGRMYGNVIATIAGEKSAAETVVIGAHYDTVTGTPGADDNASGVAVLLELSRLLRGVRPDRTIKLVFFCLEEPPVFRTPSMGSFVYAERAKAAGERIAAMISLEMLGYYGTAEGGQAFPLPFMSLFFRTTPDFIAVVGNLSSRRLVGDVAASLRETGMVVETLSTVSLVPGVDFSDHRSFWKMGYPAVMLTDTAFYRNPHYHASSDTIDTLDFRRMALLLDGLERAVRRLCRSGPA